MLPIRFGLIGFGAWGQHHANAIAKTPGAVLAAISASSQTSCDSANQAFPDALVSTDYRGLIASDDIDVVDIVVPSHLHYPIASDCLRAGKHVLLEKPMALSVSHCDELTALADARNRILAVGHELRLSSLWS